MAENVDWIGPRAGEGRKLIVIGLDGAGWKLIDPWLKSGELPNIERLRKSGCWGDLESCLPPVTVPNWKCYSTGKNPGRFGVFWFERIDCKRHSIDMPTSESYKSLELWDYLNTAGKKAGIINMPTTYPPKRIEGFMIAGGPDAGYSVETGYTYPGELEGYLKNKFQYKVHPDRLLTSKAETGEEVEEALAIIENNFKVALDLLPQADFLHVTVFYLNVLQHFFFRAEPVRRAWAIVDRYVGEFSKLGDVIVMSDHGSYEIEREFFINTWLEGEGYLKTRRGVDDRLRSVGITQEGLLGIFKGLGVMKLLHRVVPKSIQEMVPTETGTQFGPKLEKVDWAGTKAIASGQGLVYINADRGSGEYESIRSELIERIGSLRDGDAPIAASVHKWEEIYSGENVDKSPDIVFEQADGVHTNGGIGYEKVFDKPKKWDAENVRYGIIIAAGPSFKEGVELKGPRIIDLAPTVLHAFGVDIPKDMDGRVLEEIFRDGSDPASRKPSFKEYGKLPVPLTRENAEVAAVDGMSENGRDREIAKGRLKALGYLD